MVKFKAIGVSEGLAKAKALVIKEEDLSVVKETVADAEAECKRVLDAVEKAKQQIEVLRDDAEKNIGAAEAEIFDAHLMMLDDPDFVEGMTNIVTDEGLRGVRVLCQLRELSGDVPRTRRRIYAGACSRHR